MLRRDFIKATGTVIAASALPSAAAFAVEPGTQARTVLPLNRKWRYHPSKVEGAHAASFNDAGFESVVIPHTNVSLPWHNFNDKTYEFISTYRRRFRYPTAAKGKRLESREEERKHAPSRVDTRLGFLYRPPARLLFFCHLC